MNFDFYDFLLFLKPECYQQNSEALKLQKLANLELLDSISKIDFT